MPRLPQVLFFAVGLSACGGSWKVQDADGDGYTPLDGDCWDQVEGPGVGGLSGDEIHPGAAERWYDGFDQDCAGDDDYDQDGDGYVPDAYQGLPTGSVDGSGQLPAGDCWDDPAATPEAQRVVTSAFTDREGTSLDWTQPDAPSTHPGAEEVWYDGADSDCAGDDDFDQDLDGFDTDAYPNRAGVFGDDCIDGAPIDPENPAALDPGAVNPAAEETWYDGTDQDCDLEDCDQDGDDYDADPDGLGFCDNLDCDDTDPAQYPNPEIAEVWYNGLDENCDLNDGDQDGDGYWVLGYEDLVIAAGGTPLPIPAGMEGDCDDLLPGVFPGAIETWYDGVDQDCAGDDDFDQDLDGFQVEGVGGDCDDTDASINPDALETWYDGVDQDCDDASDYDADLDGYDAEAHGGPDCDDTDPAVEPGATETWYDGIDQNCDDQSDYDQDRDGDDAEAYGGADCDDLAADVHPGAADTWYDGVDANCDDASDYDQDGDGYDHSGYGGTDCADTNAAIHPGATEIWYDGINQDCGSGTDYDQDGDGYWYAGVGGVDCDDTDPDIKPSATETWYDGVDQDCDGLSDYDQDGDGYDHSSYGGTDCADTNAAIHPGATETWYDGVDQDCDGGSDYDRDGDGYLHSSYGGTDCADTNAAIHPGATETWYDGVDQDCSGGSDYDQDGDGYVHDGYGGADCDDLDAGVDPGETDDASDNLVDNDCDLWVDEEALDQDSLVFSEVSRLSTAGGTAWSRTWSANWFEVHNTESFAVALDNVAFRACDEGASCGSSGGFPSDTPAWTHCDLVNWFAVSPDAGVVVPAGGYVTFCQDSAVFGTPADCDYAWSDTSFAGSNPEGIAYSDTSLPLFRDQNGMLGVWIDGAGLDELGWWYVKSSCTTPWPLAITKTMTLSLSSATAADNGDPTAWCSASTASVWATVPQSNYGTPGAADASCP